jgi:hypothetical protein
MASTINASSTGSGGLISTGDASGEIELQANGSTKLAVTASGVAVTGTLSTTGGIPSPLTVAGNSTAGAELRLPEDTDNGSNYVALKAADNIASNVTFTLPSADGTSGQVLQTNGSGTLSFATPSSGAMTLISTQTASNSASLSWTGLSTYRSYLLILSNIVPQTSADQLNVQLGTGSGPTYIASSYYHSAVLNATNSSTPFGNSGSNDNTIDLTSGSTIAASSNGMSAVIYLINMLASPASTARVMFNCNYATGSTTFWNVQGTGVLAFNTDPKTAVRILFDTQNIASGSASLYGIQA